jgi:hypothetical protein
MRRILLDGITASGINHHFPAAIAGLPGHPVEEVTMRNIHLTYQGGGTTEDARRQPPEVPDAYPEPSMFGTLPAWALWLRHVRGLTIESFHAGHATPDARPALIQSDVEGLSIAASPLFDPR